MGRKNKSKSQVNSDSISVGVQAKISQVPPSDPSTKSKDKDSIVSSKPKKKTSKKLAAEKEISLKKDKEEDLSLEVIKGFSVLPVLVPKLNYNQENNSPEEAIHYLYFKKHLINLSSDFIPSEKSTEADESQLLPPGRTIFVTNLPVDCNEQDLIQLFSSLSISGGCRVTKVLIRTPNSLCTVPRSESLNKSNFFKKATTAVSKTLASLFPSPIQLATGRLEDTLLTCPNYAYVVLKEVAGVDRVFNYTLKKTTGNKQSDFLDSKIHFSLSNLVQLHPLASKKPNSGIERWLSQYDTQRPDSSLLQEYVDEYMGEYKHHKEVQKYQESLTLDAADEDGFVKVVKGRSTNTSGDGATVRAMTKTTAKQLTVKVSKERREQELLGDDQKMHFYKLQAHETKRTRLARLRQEFEQDKQRIAEMKRQRLSKSS